MENYGKKFQNLVGYLSCYDACDFQFKTNNNSPNCKKTSLVPTVTIPAPPGSKGFGMPQTKSQTQMLQECADRVQV
jgi:hypothetical protein